MSTTRIPIETVAAPRRTRTLARTEAKWGYLMIAPIIIGFTTFFLIALGASLVLSFSSWNMLEDPVWIGVQNYVDVWNDAAFRTALRNTFAIAVPLIVLRLVFALALAVALNSKIRFRRFYQMVFFMPVLTMPVAIGTIWKWLYDPAFGPINSFLRRVGLPAPEWLFNQNSATAAVVVVLLWSTIGYDLIIYLSGLQAIPRDYYDAAAIDGAGGFQQFRDITIPLLTPSIFFLSVIGVIGSLQVFDLVFVMTRVGESVRLPTAVFFIYQEGFINFRMGYAIAVAWVLLLMILVFTLVQFRLQRRWVHYA